ncbi:hypothetical protein O181_016791 [Austropuccinia psidii MF-1]|uniref:Uncharacterized protein n=1 Tax=Austropuccinia psidii MF-1 TaxID=1389203 RepID=A0A9Q3C2E2_9BASI|nr:hypothetical protein [Austropuccinia psidii MF-1]
MQFCFFLASVLLSTISSGLTQAVPPNHDSPEALGHLNATKPKDVWIKTIKVTTKPKAIQEAQCARNIRVPNQQFAWFAVDPTRVNIRNATYGYCFATASKPTSADLEASPLFTSFFWFKEEGMTPTPGVGPVRDPTTGAPGWNDKTGAFHAFPPGTHSNEAPASKPSSKPRKVS